MEKKYKIVIALSAVVSLIAVTAVVLVLIFFGKTNKTDGTNSGAAADAQSGAVEIKNDPLKENYLSSAEDIELDPESNMYYVSNELMVILETGTPAERIDEVIKETGGARVGTVPALDLYQIKLDEKHSLAELTEIGTQMTEKFDFVLYATYDSFSLSTSDTDVIPIGTDDPWDGDVDSVDWLDDDIDGSNWWQEIIEAPKAWAYGDKMEKITIGVCDTSIDIGHEDLKNRCSFPNSILEFRNNTDPWWNDGNKNTKNRKNQFNAHGTHVSGIIAAERNNSKGICGVADNCDLYFAPCDLSDGAVYANLTWLVESGCKVVNFSIGKSGGAESGYGLSVETLEREGIIASYFLSKLIESGHDDFIVVQSAGNGNDNGVPVDAISNGGFCSVTDETPFRSDKLTISDIRDHIIIVGSAGLKGDRVVESDYSNFGNQVNIYAPGDDIYSTLPGETFKGFEFSGGYGEESGTSMAAPIVSGVCALVWSVDPSLTAKQVKEIVCSAENTSVEVGKSDNNFSHFTGGRLVNAYLAVKAALQKEFVSDKYLVECGNTVYYADKSGLWMKRSGEKRECLVSCSATNVATDGKVIYYAKFNKEVDHHSGSMTVSVNQYDLYEYDLRTGTDTKLTSCIECGKPICAIGDVVYYTDYKDDYDGINAELAQGIRSYNKETGEKAYIADGAQLAEVYDGKIYYRDIMSAYGSFGKNQIYCYDTETGSSKKITPDGVISFKILSGKVCYSIYNQNSGKRTASVHLYTYDPAIGETVNIFSDSGDLSLKINDYDEKYIICSSEKQDRLSFFRIEIATGKKVELPASAFGGKAPNDAMRIGDRTVFYTRHGSGSIFTMDDKSEEAAALPGSYSMNDLLFIDSETVIALSDSSKNYYKYSITCTDLN